MAKPIITFVHEETYGDWLAVYADDVLVDQGHSFNTREILERLGYTVISLQAVTEDRFPESLTDVQVVTRHG